MIRKEYLACFERVQTGGAHVPESCVGNKVRKLYACWSAIHVIFLAVEQIWMMAGQSSACTDRNFKPSARLRVQDAEDGTGFCIPQAGRPVTRQ